MSVRTFYKIVRQWSAQLWFSFSKFIKVLRIFIVFLTWRMGKMFPFLWSGSPSRLVTKKKWRHGAAQNHRTPALNSDIVDISGHLDRYVSATICCQYHYIYIYISNEPCLSVNLCLFAGFAFEFMVGSKVAMLENCQTSLKSWQRCFLSIRHIYRGNFWTFVHHFLFNYKDYSWLTKAKDYSPITMSHFAILFWTSKNTTLICITLEF